MAANTTPIFTNVPVVGGGTVSTADTGYGGQGGTAPTNLKTLLTGGTNGTKINELRIAPLGTVVAGMVNIFVYDGTTYWLIDQYAITAQSVSQSAPQYIQKKNYSDLVLPSSYTLVAATTVTQSSGISVTAFGGNF